MIAYTLTGALDTSSPHPALIHLDDLAHTRRWQGYIPVTTARSTP